MYKILEEAKLFDGKQIGGGPGAKVWGWELHKGILGVIEMFSITIVVLFTQLYTFVYKPYTFAYIRILKLHT